MGNLVDVKFMPGDVIRVINRRKLDEAADIPDYQIHFMHIGTILEVTDVVESLKQVWCDFRDHPIRGIDGNEWYGHHLSQCDIELVRRPT